MSPCSLALVLASYVVQTVKTWAQLVKTNDVVNISLKFQMLMSQIGQYFLLLKNCEKHFSTKNISVPNP